jgi:hypothetical protein
MTQPTKCTHIILTFCALSTPANAASTLCLTNEDTIFSCSAGKKVISVCASKDLTAEHGYLQYRFGAPAKVELTIPGDRPVPPTNSAVSRTLVFSGGGGAYLRFKSGDYDYVVYTAIGRGWGVKDGVAIEKNGKPLTHISCKDVPISKMGEELFTKAGLKEDTKDFDLP